MPFMTHGVHSGNKGRIYRDQLFPAQAHDCWEIILILEGTGYMDVEDLQYPFTPGTIFCVPPYHVHQIIPDEYYNDYCLGIKKYLIPGDEISVFHDDDDDLFRHLIRLYDRVLRHRPVNCENILDCTESLMQHVLICWQDQKPSKELLWLAKELRNRSMDPDFKASDAISEIPLTDDYIRKQFRRQFGSSPVTYLNNLRIQHACRYLLATDYSISELAYRCGFYDPRYFNRLFRNLIGVTPKEYRQQAKERKAERQSSST